MSLGVSVAQLSISIEGPVAVLRAIAGWLHPFTALDDESASVRLTVEPESERFDDEPKVVPGPPLSLDHERIVLDGGYRGWLDLDACEGVATHVTGIHDVDAMLRLCLASILPVRGALLLHAAVTRSPSGAIVWAGAKGAGKSTVALLFGGASDELAVIDRRGMAHATPYWRGTPFEAGCERIVCLERGTAEVRSLHGAAALAELAKHVIRYVRMERVDAAILDVLADVVQRVEIVRATCPEGNAFPPFIADLIAMVPA